MMNNHKKRFQKAQNITIAGILSNILLVVLKGVVGWLGKSQALMADAFHTFSDLFSNFIVYVSLKVSKKPVDETHPYGHGKAESIAASTVGIILIGGGLIILFGSIRNVVYGDIVRPALLTLAIAIFSFVGKEILFRVTYIIGKNLKSPAVIASAWDHRSDAYSSIGVSIGIFGAIIGFPVLDSIAGAMVSVFIIKIGYKLAIESGQRLMDKSIDEETIKKIEKIAGSVKGVEHIHEVKARYMGQFVLVDLKIEVDSELTIARGHSIGGKVKYAIMENIPNISDVMVHINPHLAHN